MLPKTITLTPVNDDNGIAASQTPGGAGNLTIAGALASGGTVTLAHAHLVTIWGGSDESGKTFTVYGADSRGLSISEAVTGPNNSTVSTTLYFKTITRIAVNAATAGAVIAGVNGLSVGPWLPQNRGMDDFELSASVDISGTMTADVQHTLNNVQNANEALSIGTHGSLASLTADADGNYDFPVCAIRLAVTAFTSGTASITTLMAG